jgi:hypothetical protein
MILKKIRERMPKREREDKHTFHIPDPRKGLTDQLELI